MLHIGNNKSMFYAIRPIIKSYQWNSPVQILNMKVFILPFIFFPLINRVIPGKRRSAHARTTNDSTRTNTQSLISSAKKHTYRNPKGNKARRTLRP